MSNKKVKDTETLDGTESNTSKTLILRNQSLVENLLEFTEEGLTQFFSSEQGIFRRFQCHLYIQSRVI